MKLTITERDKKLLILLAWVCLIVGVGYYVIRPLVEKKEQIQVELDEQLVIQEELQNKVAMVSIAEKGRDEALASLHDAQKQFFPLMQNTDVDKMFTEMALNNDLIVNDMNITNPEAGVYTALTSYYGESQEESLSSVPSVYTVPVSMQMTGKRANLQKMIDECAALEPKVRVTGFDWSDYQGDIITTVPVIDKEPAKNTDNSDEEAEEETEPQTETIVTEGNYTLTMNMELYMYESEDQYMQYGLTNPVSEEEGSTEADDTANYLD